jgi:hypothetical protein
MIALVGKIHRHNISSRALRASNFGRSDKIPHYGNYTNNHGFSSLGILTRSFAGGTMGPNRPSLLITSIGNLSIAENLCFLTKRRICDGWKLVVAELHLWGLSMVQLPLQ